METRVVSPVIIMFEHLQISYCHAMVYVPGVLKVEAFCIGNTSHPWNHWDDPSVSSIIESGH